MQPLVEELVPCPEPWDVARKLSHLPHLLFLDSSDRQPDRGRYSYVMADPSQIITNFETLAVSSNVRNSNAELPPFQGGWAGLLTYELGGYFDRQPLPRQIDFDLPNVCFGRYDWVLAFDHVQSRAWLIVNEGTGSVSLRVYKSAARRMRMILRWLSQPSVVESKQEREPRYTVRSPRTDETTLRIRMVDSDTTVMDVNSNFHTKDYHNAVQRCIDYIHAGDVFQVNLAQRLIVPNNEMPMEVYGRLRKRSPASFSCYFDAGGFQVLSASPERFLKVTADGAISAKPIKGTRPRGKTPAEDEALVRDLMTNPKDRAENVMIVDLLRNDIGKVAEFGSVKVPKVCELETYNYVHHLVSEVTGQLRADKTPFDLLRAAFPGGSVTGAPKVRAMEIIAELEPHARGAYCGSIGYIGFDGAMDTNILIRTMTASQGWLQFPVGGGIVADSDPQAEYEETLTKAQGMLRALKAD